MAVGSTELEALLPVNGIAIGVAESGIKYKHRRDLVVFKLAEDSVVAGVFTKNAFCAAPVVVAKSHLASGIDTRYLVINTGNANAGTGEQGYADAISTCSHLAQIAAVANESILPFSTGVIGEHLPLDRVLAGVESACGQFIEDNWLNAAWGIMTTDTIPKGLSVQFEHRGEPITVTGISKGSGMINPNMATMLSFIATDARVSRECLQEILDETTSTSFNRITVDGDTSTNDSSILIATGQAKVDECTGHDSAIYPQLKQAIATVMLHLAQSIIRDGEGATKFVTIEITSAGTRKEALDVAYTIAHSPLVKTALNASDANWGRILAAVGRAGVPDLDVSKIAMHVNGVQIVESGCRAASYTEEAGSLAMAEEDITIIVSLGRGDISDKIYTTDLSHDYISINADYRS